MIVSTHMLNKKRKMKGKEKRNGRKYFSYTNDLSTVTIVGTVREGPKVGPRGAESVRRMRARPPAATPASDC